MAIGTCKLTQCKGKLVKSHIIPKALTYPDEFGLPFTQSGSGQRQIKRWDSWYDPALCTEEGEQILRDIDTQAIPFLRSSQLVWSGWGPMRSLPVTNVGVAGWGFRQVSVPDPQLFRRFLHSLLWRAAASNLKEFREVDIPSSHLERLRQVVLGEREESEAFYPALLTQLSTMGIIHNLTPIAQTKTIPIIGTDHGRDVPIFRFYFDGLIVHFHRQAEDDGYTKEIGNMIVGSEQELFISTVTFESSFQLENLMAIWSETYR